MGATAILTAAFPANLGQPHKYGFQCTRFTLMLVTAWLNANISGTDCHVLS